MAHMESLWPRLAGAGGVGEDVSVHVEDGTSLHEAQRYSRFTRRSVTRGLRRP